MCNFNEQDVITIAKVILKDCIEATSNSGDYIKFQYSCAYCSAESNDFKNFNHELNCPVLIAQDILTRKI